MKGKLRWKKAARETGLAAVCAGPRPYYLWDGVTEYATVYAIGGGWRGPITGWYWSAPSLGAMPWKNTSNSPTSEAEAKKQAMDYVKSHLSKATDSNLTEGVDSAAPEA